MIPGSHNIDGDGSVGRRAGARTRLRCAGAQPLLDGFGLIALASLFPMMTVMGYVQLSGWLTKADQQQNETEEEETSS